MATNATEARQAARSGRQGGATPSGGNPPGSDLRTVAGQVEGLLDDDGHYNPNPDEISRGHPDYDPDADPRNQPQQRDSRGRFQKAGDASEDETGQSDEITQAEQLDELDESDDEQQDTAADTDKDEGDEAKSDASENASTEDGDTEPADAIETIAQLAEALDISVDDLKGQISHTFQAAGEDVTVTLAELETGYQKEADYRRSTAQVAEFRRAVETEMQTRHQAYEQQQHVMAQQLGMAEQILAADLNSPQLAALRESAPDEWTARQHELGQRLAALQNTRQQAAAQYEQFRQTNLQQLRAREMQTLQEAIPDFGQQHAALAKEVIGSLGYAPQEVSQIFDSRLVRGALELGALRARNSELEAQIAKAGETVKRVKKDVPKLAKPGKQVSPDARGKRLQRDNVKRLQSRLRKSGKVDDAAAVIETML